MAGTIYYTEIPKICNKYGLSGADLSNFNIDRSDFLEKYIQNKGKNFIFGEF